ncbi:MULTISPECIES: LON peptidase substrate-binding domain-containing protein [unclassified Microbacterium]|uniref:LON peptidase substrate-binding domain-containing protein n=1 Tax=unclassified Microbacterium TaxID=2609290 RepID=UPI00257BBD6A|nr:MULTISPECIES: LON peptidase substrate-binding domain-containing protein [unclassified Microbacterium]|tara:strand:+ start:2206 stop:2904 length:699 start_codon:yes stop_codon:yes gene_type:complete
MRETAMFPLSSVLMPHMPLPLRIFESRYLVMLGRLLDDDDPRFGVVLIERGPEAGGGEQRFSVGTLARVSRVAAREDDLQLVAVGGGRFEVERWLDDDPYPRAIVRELPMPPWRDDLLPLRERAEQTVRRLLSMSAEFAELPWDADIELADDPEHACWQLAGIAPLSTLDHLALLQASSLDQLLADLIARCDEAEPVLTAGTPDGAFGAELDRLLDDVEGDEESPGPADGDR